MSSYQRITIVGNLGSAPDIKHLDSGATVANLSVAVSESWKDKNTGDKREKTEWFRCVLWRGLADVAGTYLNKGDKVLIEGKMETRKWTNKEGEERQITELIAREMQMLGQGNSERSSSSPAEPQHAAPTGPTKDDLPF